MDHDNELESWKVAWQGWQDTSLDWTRKAQLAHRREERWRVSYWLALAAGALVMLLAISRFGVVSWLRVGVGAAALVVGVGVMLHSARRLERDQRLLAASPHGLIADLMRLHEREIEGWTAKRWQLSVLAIAAAGGVVAGQRVYEALTRQESLLVPIIVSLLYAVALGVVARFGAARVRVLRRELSVLERVQAELSK
jgi:hypothetical protein